MILCDREIDETFNLRSSDFLCGILGGAGEISPFCPDQVAIEEGNKVISYGLSSFGYDARLGNQFISFGLERSSSVIDPKDPNACTARKFQVDSYDSILIPANSFVLGCTLEYFRMPDDVMAICVGKSTYDRCGVIVNVTPLEPGWSGFVTLGLSNTSPVPARVYVGEGICQFLFFKHPIGPDLTYYGNREQVGAQIAKMSRDHNHAEEIT